MTITLHSTSYGGAATALLRDRVAALKANLPLRPVTIVVPSNFVGVSVRRDLAANLPGNGVVGLGILTVYRLAELLGAAPLAATGRRPVSTPVIGAAIRSVLADEPGIFVDVARHPATEASLVRVFRELSDCTPEALDHLAGASARAGEVVRVHLGARARLQAGWYDEADLMAAATTALATSSVVRDLGTVFLHLPQRLSPAGAGLIVALGARTDVEVVAALTGHADADVEVVRCLERLGLPVPVAEPMPMAVTQVVTASDADEEVRSAVAVVIDAARRGVPLEHMAILHPSRRPYARIVEEQLRAAGIDWNGQAVRPLSERLAGRWLLDLLDLADGRWTRPQVLGLFASAPLRTVRGHVVKVASWERISREAGIVEGRDEWAGRLAGFADERRADAELEAAKDDVERQDGRVERDREQARTADELAEVVAALAADLDTGAEHDSWRALATWASWMLANHLGREEERRAWPPQEQDAAQKVEAALDRLAALDEVEPATDLETFARALTLELEADLGRRGRFGEGVLVGGISAALGVQLEVLVVLGLAEGVLPTRPREDSLLADADRELVASELAPRARRVGTEHHALLAALAAASTQRILVFPRGDLRRSVERAPSRWLLDALEEVTGERRLAAAPQVEAVSSFAGRVIATTFPADDQAQRLAATGRRLAGARLSAADAREIDGELAAGVELLTGRGGSRLTRFNGDLGLVAELIDDQHRPDAPQSATRVQSYLSCPHGYLVRNLLGIEPVENPEEQLEVSPLIRGDLVHRVFEEWLREQLDLGRVPRPGSPWPEVACDRLALIADRELDRLAASGVVGHPVLWRGERVRILTDILAFPGRDDVFRRTFRATPTHVEAPFGMQGAAPLDVDLGDGRTMRFRGSIDRLDRDEDGGIVVTDYKTGRADDFAGLSAADPDGAGSNLQLMLYALAARQIVGQPEAAVHARYWFTSAKGRWGEVGYDIDEAILERLRHVLRTVADQIHAGRFPQRPEAPGWAMWVSCHYCDPDGLGTAARHREWERLVAAPELADYLAVVEPGLGVAP